MKPRPTKAAKQLDQMISDIYRVHGANVSIRLMAITDIYTAGRAAYHAGRDVTAAVVAAIEEARA